MLFRPNDNYLKWSLGELFFKVITLLFSTVSLARDINITMYHRELPARITVFQKFYVDVNIQAKFFLLAAKVLYSSVL